MGPIICRHVRDESKTNSFGKYKLVDTKCLQNGMLIQKKKNRPLRSEEWRFDLHVFTYGKNQLVNFNLQDHYENVSPASIHCRATIGPPARRHSNGTSLADR